MTVTAAEKKTVAAFLEVNFPPPTSDKEDSHRSSRLESREMRVCPTRVRGQKNAVLRDETSSG